MSKKMRFVIKIEDENGGAIVTKEASREIPYVEEIEAQGFRTAFNYLEIAALELTKETREAAISEYITETSKKKRNQKVSREEPS